MLMKAFKYQKYGNFRQSRSGFTFIELMVVVAIIGILSGLFVTQYPAVQRRARDTNRRSDIKQYQTSMESYAFRNNGNYPASGGIINISGTYCSTTLGLPDCPTDPKAPAAIYQVNSTTLVYVIWAKLEQPPTPVTYFIVCSTGEAGDSTTVPSGSCPL
jgi:general secretion pathway protein G